MLVIISLLALKMTYSKILQEEAAAIYLQCVLERNYKLPVTAGNFIAGFYDRLLCNVSILFHDKGLKNEFPILFIV